MKTKTILNFRNIYQSIFTFLRKIHMKRFVYKQKKRYSQKDVLSNAQKKEIRDYYKNYKKISTIYHNFYTEKTGEFHVDYITDDIYFNDINYYYNDFNAFKVVDNKANYDKLFPSINQPKILASRKNGFWYIDDEIVDFENVKNSLSNYTAFFIKQATDCGGASGVYYFDNNEIDNLSINLDKIVNDISSDIAIQELVIQHDDVAKLNPSSVNTLRILTLLGNDGNVKVYSTLLRIGGGYTKVDNFCSGGMAVGVADNGKLKKYGYYLNGNSITQHPLSKIDFLDYQLPSIDKAKELVKKAHIYVPHFRMVSWDVAIEKDGTPILIEANLADGQLDLHQLTNGPLFKEDTKKILDEVFNAGGNV